MKQDLTGFYYAKLVKTLIYLEFTFNRVKLSPTSPAELSEDDLERWDSLATRFARASDLFLSKYLRAAILKDDPAFDGSFRDFLNRAEKLRLIDDVQIWLEVRTLRNVAVHEYAEGDLEKVFQKLIEFTPIVLDLRSRLSDAPQSI